MNKNKRVRRRIYQPTEGEILFSVATGHVNAFKKASREAVKMLSTQPGFVASHPCERGTLWFYDTLNHAKGARNVARAEGVICGVNICKFVYHNGQFVLDKEQP